MDTPIEYEALAKVGAIVGSGGLVVVDQNTCMVDFARYFLTFTQDESCGKCVPCRIGTKRMLEIVTRITEGEGEEGDIEQLEQLAHDVKRASLCGLGQTAPNPVLTTIHYFREEYEEHIRDKPLPRRRMRRAVAIRDRCRGVQGLRRVQEALPRRRDLGRDEGSRTRSVPIAASSAVSAWSTVRSTRSSGCRASGRRRSCVGGRASHEGRDIMTARVVSIPREATVTDAASTMRDEQVGSVLVVEDEKLVGHHSPTARSLTP